MIDLAAFYAAVANEGALPKAHAIASLAGNKGREIANRPRPAPFGDVERLYLVHRLLLLPVGFSWPVVSAEQCSPSVQLHYRAFIPNTSCSVPVRPHRYSDPRGISRLSKYFASVYKICQAMVDSSSKPGDA
jgi:hypothetical protein